MVHAGGRPTEYKEEYIAMVDEYINSCQDYIEKNGRLKVNIPKIEGLSLYLGVSRRVLFEWEKKYPEFMHALDKIRGEQSSRLQDNGLAGTYNPTIAKLMLSSNHGMREKSDVTSDDKPIGETLIELIKYGTTNKE